MGSDLESDIIGLGEVLSTPRLSGKWKTLRSLVKRNHPEVWRELKLAKGVGREARERWNTEGPELVTGAAKRRAKRARNYLSGVNRAPDRGRSDIIWLDLGDFGSLIDPDNDGTFQDHGLGLLRTVLHQAGVYTDLTSTRTVRGWDEVTENLRGYSRLVMNVRSYTFPFAREAARIFKQINPGGLVITGGMHAAVAGHEMQIVEEFDKICTGPGEGLIVDLVSNPASFPRVFDGKGAKSMAEWPVIDRTLWPKPTGKLLLLKHEWPLESDIGWGPNPVATMLTSRVCPWRCSFCNENSFVPNMGRRTVDSVIDELNDLDDKYGLGSVVIHDSMFFQNPSWLKEWLDKYPKRANKLWPYWAAARADTVRQWPDLFEALVRETNWRTISIGFESGSNPVLRTLNKECTEDDNDFAIELVNRIGDDFERDGKIPPKLWSNIMLAIPGETREDAFKTIRMLKRMKRVNASLAFYAPYPGSVLGHQLIAEGKSLMDEDQRERGITADKVRGIDYEFYRDLLRGTYDDQINEGLDPILAANVPTLLGDFRLADALEG